MASRVEKKLLNGVGRAISDYRMIQKGDRLLVCLSGGKDSFVLLRLLKLLRLRTRFLFDIFSLTINPGFQNWDDSAMCAWLKSQEIPFEVVHGDIFKIIKTKLKRDERYCSFCSRLRRGMIYSYAQKHGFRKVALGHHRDDLITSLLMSILYSGEIRSMPPKLLTNTKKQIVIRPLVYCQEKDIILYAKEQAFPCMPRNLCGEKESQTRARMQALIQTLAEQNPKVPSNMLHALQNIKFSQLMDQRIFQFKNLEEQYVMNEE